MSTPACVVRAEAAIHPSEDPRKVQKAIHNMLPDIDVATGPKAAKAVFDHMFCLEYLRQSLASRQSQAVLRRNLTQNTSDTTTWFYLNKQAALAGVAAICEEAGESPLGPIRITLESADIPRIMDWLCGTK